MDKLYGYAGKLLRVDLTNEAITEEELDAETARKYIGGTGFGAKYLYEEVPAGVEWSDESNRLIIASGPLGGTSIGGSGTISVVTKGPLTNGAAATQANGFFGAFLRFCGYDGIIIQGKAKRWVYLHVYDGGAELRNASHLVGRDTWETCDLIKSEFGKKERGMSVACIGVAGENLVKFAAPVVDKDHVPSKNGTGAVMGSKLLKAIAVDRGSKSPPLYDKKSFDAVAKQFREEVLTYPFTRWGTAGSFAGGEVAKLGMLPIKNYSTTVPDVPLEVIDKFGTPYMRKAYQAERDPCWACGAHHSHKLTITEGPYKGQAAYEAEYEGLCALGPIIGNYDASAALFLANHADRLGIDVNELGWVLGLAIECYEKGLLSREQTDGIELTWGNCEAVYQMMERIARRQGFGDVLAEGAMRAARRIGGEAPNLAVCTLKGTTPRGVEFRHIWPWLVDHYVSQGGTNEGMEYILRPEDVGISAPEGLRLAPNLSPEDAVDFNVKCNWSAHFNDSLGVCWFTTNGDFKRLAAALRAATGWDFPAEETVIVGNRIQNLLRVFNIRHGHTPEMDAPSPRLGGPPADGMAKGQSFRDQWPEMRRAYYRGKGWDEETGRPLPETLRKLGLEHTIPELWGK
jgi:aldehyde:ferredoxin oxidoreductase